MTTPEFKVIFPAPPPTTNALTPQQRTQLVRKTRKIEQIFGAAPRLIDTSPGPFRISLPYAFSQHRFSKGRRSSVDSTSSGSSSGSMTSTQRSYSFSTSFVLPISSKKGSKRHSSPIQASKEVFQSVTYDNTAPLLRIAMESMTLETVPASPSPTQDFFSVPSPPVQTANSNEEIPTDVFALPTEECSSPRSSLVLTTKVPSLNSLRKQKMDRLRKKLGSDVPFDLVFPNAKDNENDISAARSENIPPLPSRFKHAGKNATARAHGTAGAKANMKHRKSRSEPTPLSASGKKLKQKLSCIIESPDEHGSIGYSEEFGVSRVPSKESDLMLGWRIESHGTEFSLWDATNEWDMTPLVSETLSPVAMPSLSNSSSDDSSSAPSSDIDSPVTPVSSLSPDTLSSPSSTGATANGEVKKRPASYRKPPPPVSDDCF